MERFQQKWLAVLRFENATLERTTTRFQQKWIAVLRFENATGDK